MNTRPSTVLAFLLGAASALFSLTQPLHSEPASGNTFMGGLAAPAVRDGRHDFDFLAGSWTFHMRKLVNPLTGSTTWQEFDGSSTTRLLFDGRANVEELVVNGPAGRIEGLTVRTYNPQSGQWSIYWGNMKAGNLGQPVIATVGSFKDGRGTFYDQETIDGRVILVRYEWYDITPHSAKFQQSFSADGGNTWEVNWASSQTRIPQDSAAR